VAFDCDTGQTKNDNFMRKFKSLELLALAIDGGRIELLRFRDQVGKYHLGFAIVDKDNNELLEIEPVHYSNGDRWKLNNRCEGGRIAYAKTMRGAHRLVLSQPFKPGLTGFKFNTSVNGRTMVIL
jgi:hypothetical protein